MDDNEYLQGIIDATKDSVIPHINPRTGASLWEITSPLMLSSGCHVIMDSCTLRLRDGVYSNIFISRGAWEQSAPAVNDISVTGKGDAVLDGGNPNGLCERNSLRDGNPSILTSTLILFRGVQDFSVSSLKLKNLRYWGMTYYYCSHGMITDCGFEADNSLPNQDGIDLRRGCHDIKISGFYGTSGDDCIALTALHHPQERVFDIPSKNPDVSDIEITDFCGESTGGHGLIRLLCHDGIKMHGIVLKNIEDTSVSSGGKLCRGSLRFGDKNYWTVKPAADGDMSDISVDGVTCRGEHAVMLYGSIPRLTLTNITNTYESGDILVQYR